MKTKKESKINISFKGIAMTELLNRLTIHEKKLLEFWYGDAKRDVNELRRNRGMRPIARHMSVKISSL